MVVVLMMKLAVSTGSKYSMAIVPLPFVTTYPARSFFYDVQKQKGSVVKIHLN